jgi:hypothetical protein
MDNSNSQKSLNHGRHELMLEIKKFLSKKARMRSNYYSNKKNTALSKGCTNFRLGAFWDTLFPLLTRTEKVLETEENF